MTTNDSGKLNRGDGHLAIHKETGKLVNVCRVTNGLACGCICAGCGGEMVAKNNGTKKAHHFAHHVASTSCGESALHKVAKMALMDRLENALLDGAAVPLEWFCERCKEVHIDDMIKMVEADEVWMEKAVPDGGIRPDLTLSQKGKDRAFIEVVVTHAPEPGTEAYAFGDSIALVVLKVVDWHSVDALISGALKPTDLKYCPRRDNVPAWFLDEGIGPMLISDDRPGLGPHRRMSGGLYGSPGVRM